MQTPIVNEEDVEFSLPPMYTRQDLGLMLYADHLARKQRNWSLVDSQTILEINQAIISLAEGYSGLFDTREVFTVNNQHPIATLRDPHRSFAESFPFVEAILRRFDGKLIVAGGSVYKAFQPDDHGEMLQDCDVDCFFISCTEREVEDIIRFAIELIEDPRTYAKYFSGDMRDEVESGTFDEMRICIDRCQNVTTLYYWQGEEIHDEADLNYLAEHNWMNGGGGKLQFIHRVYPSAASVIGAFDLGPCMGFYDGHDFFATPMGAWSMATQTIILDVSRRSTSFEYRIKKYITNGRCRLVIVNGSSTDTYQRLESDPLLAKRQLRWFYPVKGLKTSSQHVEIADFDGLDERIAIRKAMGKGWDESMNPVAPLRSRDKKNYNRFYDEYQKKLEELKTNQDYFDYCLLANRDAALQNQARYQGIFTLRFRAASHNSDYDGGNFHEFSVEESNGIFAAQGKVDCITWRSGTLEAAFEKPLIKFKIHPDLREDTEIPRTMYLDAMRRWFTPEEIEKLKAGPIEPPQCLPIHAEVLDVYAAEIRERVEQKIAVARNRARHGVTILMENPGRQWTASRNPVVSDVRDYYHPWMLEGRGPLVIGIPQPLYALLRLAQLKSDSVWRWLPRDVLWLIMHQLAELLANDGNDKLLGLSP